MDKEYQDYVDQYMNGYCMFMAAALHHYYGFPIGLMIVMHGGTERLSHAWVNLPDGQYLDIQGEQTLREVTSFSEDAPSQYKVYETTTLEHLERLAGTKLPPDEPDVILALDVAETHLERELRRWKRKSLCKGRSPTTTCES